MSECLWKIVAWVVSRRPVASWLMRRAQRTPYLHIYSPDGSEVYMYRWWLFNPCDNDTRQCRYRWCPISIRVHRIMTPDNDRHLHDHPWNAQTIILDGWYTERRQFSNHTRIEGDTAPLRFGEYHQITDVSRTGATTLFITGKYRGTWGFLVDGIKIRYREYLGIGE